MRCAALVVVPGARRAHRADAWRVVRYDFVVRPAAPRVRFIRCY